MRIVIADPKTGKSYQKELEKEQEALVLGKKIGDALDGGALGLAGYSLELTGGSDGSGFPMRRDVSGPRKVAILLSDGTGFHATRKGMRKRKTVRGNTYGPDAMQINAKVKTAGSTALDQLLGKTEEKPKEEKK